MFDKCDGKVDQIAQLRQRIIELEGCIQQQDATVQQCEAVIRKLRKRVGNGFRDEVRAFSDSIKGLLYEGKP